MVHHKLVKKVFLPKREDCLEYLREIRWHGVVRCLYCGSNDVWSDGFTPCKEVSVSENKYFNDLTGTIFEHHHFPIEEMFYIIKEMEVKSTNQKRS